MTPQSAGTLAMATINPCDASTLLSNKPQDVHSRFLDLPPELRIIIYSFALSDDDDELDFCFFKPPALTRVSRQLRAESLPVFYAETRFYIKIYTNIEACHSAICPSTMMTRNIPGALFGEVDCTKQSFQRGAEYAGRIYTTRGVQDFVAASGGNAIFNNITFRPDRHSTVTESMRKDWLMGPKIPYDWTAQFAWAILEGGSCGFRYNWHWESPAVRCRYINATEDRIERTVKNIAARSGFKGFAFGDLEDIASQYKWTELLSSTLVETRFSQQ